MGPSWNDTRTDNRNSNYSEKYPSRCHFVRHKIPRDVVCDGIEALAIRKQRRTA